VCSAPGCLLPYHNKQQLVPKTLAYRDYDSGTEQTPGVSISMGLGQLTSAEPPHAAVRRPGAYCLRIVAAPFQEQMPFLCSGLGLPWALKRGEKFAVHERSAGIRTVHTAQVRHEEPAA
jgi:hypothetical protein